MSQKRILVIAAHPDDELLGAGATLAAHVKKGDLVQALILGEGIMSREQGSQEEMKELQKQSEEAGKTIGFAAVSFGSFPDNAFDTVALLHIAKEVEKKIAEFKPDTIYTHHGKDLNVDHRRTFEAVMTACRPCNADAPAEIFTFETLSSTEWQSKQEEPFRPNVYINVESTIEQKIEAFKKYKSEIRDYPHSRSAEGLKILAQYRGLEAGLKFAEAFHLERSIKKDSV
ncbi:PIG-L family deacetylase [Candidatus Uhrbacteria bacterium]|nr:PIG-L family deacetylase [Candidatus Uhrbacteria bacterium]